MTLIIIRLKTYLTALFTYGKQHPRRSTVFASIFTDGENKLQHAQHEVQSCKVIVEDAVLPLRPKEIESRSAPDNDTPSESDTLAFEEYVNEYEKEPTQNDVHLFTNIMRSTLVIVLVPLIAGVVLAPLSPLHAFTYTQDNIHVAYHEAPSSFSFDEYGQAFGQTVSGMAFRQLNVTNQLGIRFQKFEIGTAFWYISDRGVIWAASDLEALSIYISRIA